MCAGVTVFAPFKDLNIRPGHKVAILGVGGLGHLAIKFARAFGCEVFALSGTPDKEKECRAMGAHGFVHTGRQLRPGENCYLKPVGEGETAPLYDYFFMCQSGSNVKWHAIIDSLAMNGTVALMGNPADHNPAAPAAPAPSSDPAAAAPAPTKPQDAISMLMIQLLRGAKHVCGCASGSRAVAVEMLNFAALHGILPTCEVFKWDEFDQALARVESGKIRFRAVLEHNKNKAAFGV
jgi:uncharacterized zinc-type alcohol dehydrogenase-like protein